MHDLEHLETTTAELIQERITAFVACLNEEMFHGIVENTNTVEAA